MLNSYQSLYKQVENFHKLYQCLLKKKKILFSLVTFFCDQPITGHVDDVTLHYVDTLSFAIYGMGEVPFANYNMGFLRILASDDSNSDMVPFQLKNALRFAQSVVHVWKVVDMS